MDWYPVYDPLGTVAASALLALVPFVLMFVLLSRLRVRGYAAGLGVLGASCALASVIWRYPVAKLAATVAYGAAFGLFPISYIIFSSMLLYELAVAHGEVEVMQASLERITSDRRLQAIVIGFAFGALLDATAGFLTPVSVTTAILVALGFPPLLGAQVALVGCALPAVAGAMGVPLLVTAQVTGFAPAAVARAVATQTLPLFAVTPFLVGVWVGGAGRVREVWRQAAVIGVGYGLALAAAAYLGNPNVAGLVAASVGLGASVLCLRVLPAPSDYRLPGEVASAPGPALGGARVARAWLPFLLLAALVTVWNWPGLRQWLDGLSLTVSFAPIAGTVFRVPPAVPAPVALPGTMDVNLGSSAGTAILLAAAVAAGAYRIPPAEVGKLAVRVARRLGPAVLTMATVFGAAFVLNYSGMAMTLGLALAVSGPAVAALAPAVTGLGAFLTGSNTASNAMFSGLLVAAANRLGLPPLLAVAGGSAGAAVGKMVSPQCLAAAAVAAGGEVEEGALLQAVWRWALVLAGFAGVLTLARSWIW